MEIFVFKETPVKADSGRKFLEINLQDVNIQKQVYHINVGFGTKLHIAEY